MPLECILLVKAYNSVLSELCVCVALGLEWLRCGKGKYIKGTLT